MTALPIKGWVLTAKGLADLKKGELSPGKTLLLEIIKRAGGPISQENAIDIAVTLTLRFGSEQAALDQLQAGHVEIERDNDGQPAVE